MRLNWTWKFVRAFDADTLGDGIAATLRERVRQYRAP
jgi:hypothetical protein